MPILPIRTPTYSVPKYSLTGDLLSFSKCGLQYRYTNGSALPPSRPVQRWFGEFIHGVLELAIRYFQQGDLGTLPWDESVVRSKICDPVANRLASEGRVARSTRAEENGRNRALVAINDLGRILFPLVDSPEIAISGTRAMPSSSLFRAKYFEITGRIDVVTSFSLQSFSQGQNPIVDKVSELVVSPEDDQPFEVLVDYKGTRRPATTSEEWNLYEWQLQTYAWLRSQQPDSLPVRAGLVIFVNELLPSETDIARLRTNIAGNETDVHPAPNSNDQRIILGTHRGKSPFGLSWNFRLARSLRSISVGATAQANALDRFDKVIEKIESCVDKELRSGSIQQSWNPRPQEETCIACDFNTVCPDSEYKGPALAPLGRRDPDNFA